MSIKKVYFQAVIFQKVNSFFSAYFLFFCLFFIQKNIYAQTALDAQIEKVKNTKGLEGAILGVSVVDVETNQELFSYQSNFALKPASSQKLITTGTALGILGENFKFETNLYYKGKIENGILYGDIIIQGGGDPTLGFMRYSMGKKSKELSKEWISKIKAIGINKIEGKIIADPTIFDSQLIPRNWQWEDIGNYFGAGVAGLNFHENKYEIQFLPKGKVGEQAEIVLINPPLGEFEIVNEVRIGTPNSGDQAYVFCAPYSKTIVIRGTVPQTSKAFTIKGAVQNPALFTASFLQNELNKSKIEVENGVDFLFSKNAELYNNAILFHTHYSAPLSEIIYWANKKSINIYCEALLKMIGLKVAKKGTYEAGIKAIQNYWKKNGVNISGWRLCDGSGLSPSNAIPAKVQAQIIAMLAKKPFFKPLNNSLSFACVSDYGSMGGMLCNTEMSNNLRAKSGYIAHCRAYAGLFTNRCGKTMAFSVILNNFHCHKSKSRQLVSQIMEKLIEVE